MSAGKWLLPLALALATTSVATGAETKSLPSCPGGDNASADIFRDNCQARVRFASGVYIGEFRNNRRDGKGVWIYPNGARYTGDFKDGKPSGAGTYAYPNGSKYVGGFRDGKFNGRGVLYAADGAVMSSGLFADDKFVEGAPRAMTEAAPSAPAEAPPPLGPKSVRLIQSGDQNLVPITLNGIVTLNAVVDSGADPIVIPADAFTKLENNHTLSAEDYLGKTTVMLASGEQSEAKVVRIRSLKVGEIKVSDVVAVVGPKQAPTLLGQTFLRKFRSWSIDNHRHTLNLE
jgi:hypothetical protein